MRIEAPKPDVGMSPWLIAVLIMLMIFIKTLVWVIISIVLYLVWQVGWCFWMAWKEISEERRNLTEDR